MTTIPINREQPSKQLEQIADNIRQICDSLRQQENVAHWDDTYSRNQKISNIESERQNLKDIQSKYTDLKSRYDSKKDELQTSEITFDAETVSRLTEQSDNIDSHIKTLETEIHDLRNYSQNVKENVANLNQPSTTTTASNVYATIWNEYSNELIADIKTELDGPAQGNTQDNNSPDRGNNSCKIQ